MLTTQKDTVKWRKLGIIEMLGDLLLKKRKLEVGKND